MTSSAWVPTEPVLPRIATRRAARPDVPGFTTVDPAPACRSSGHACAASSSDEAAGDDQVEDGGQAEQHRVEAVEHAAVPGQQRAQVLEPEVALQHRLAEVTERGEGRDDEAEQQAVAERVPGRDVEHAAD